MPSIVVCPKCQARYQLAETMLGKTIQCKKCSAKFVAKAGSDLTASAAKSGGAKSGVRKEAAGKIPSPPISRYSEGAPAEELARFGISGPLVRQSDPMAENLAPPAKDILGNYATDPGFVIPETTESDDEDSDTSSLDAVIENPFAAEAKQFSTNDNDGPRQGFGYSDLQAATRMVVVSYAVMTLAVAVAFMTPIVYLQMGSSITEETAAQIGLVMFIAYLVFAFAQSYYYLAGSMFSYQGHENLKQLGIKEPTWSSVFAGFAWFIPLANIVIPLLTTIELANTSDKFSEKKGGGKRTLGLVWAWWVVSNCVWIAFVVYIVMALISAATASFESVASTSLSEGFTLLVVFAVIILGLMIATMVLIQKVGASVSSNQQKQWRKLRKSKKPKGHAAPSTYPPVYVGIGTLMASVPLSIFGVMGLIFGFAGIAAALGIESPILGWIFLIAVILILLVALGISIKGIIIIIKGLKSSS